MRDYGRVHSTFWSSQTTGTLSDDGKMLALYLMTCSHSTIAGVFRLPDGYVSEDLGWPVERVAEGFRELLAKGFASRCETTKWVWVIKHLEWNPPENPNQRKSAVKVAASVPLECGWKREFMRLCGESLGMEPLPYQNPSTTVGEPLLNQKQEQKQEQKQQQDQDVRAADAGAPAAVAPDKKGARLPDAWALPKAWGLWATAEYPHWSADVVRSIAAEFADHWRAKTGKDATKLDWEATWRNWCRSAITQRAHPPLGGRPVDTKARDAEARRLLGFNTPETLDA